LALKLDDFEKLSKTYFLVKEKIPQSWFYTAPVVDVSIPISKDWTTVGFPYKIEYATPKDNQIFYPIDPAFSIPLQEENMENTAILEMKETKPDVPTQKILDLMPGSVFEDWHRHKNTNGYLPGGWVYKDSQVDASANVGKNAVVCGSSIVGPNCLIWGESLVHDSKIEEHTTVNDKSFLSGAIVGDSSIIQGTAEIYGTVGCGCYICGDTIVAKGKKVGDRKTLSQTPIDYRTQKTRGLSALSKHYFPVPENKLYDIEWLKTKKQLQELIGKFVRPCPVIPRHGFVDSRPVNTLEEAQQIVKETRQADENAEIIAMPFIKSSHSGVWTEGSLSIGQGNDGATSGRDSIRISTIGSPYSHIVIWGNLLKDAGITEAPYLEILWREYTHKLCVFCNIKQKLVIREDKEYSPQYVQLRNGPKLPDSIDFIPKKITVTSIVEAKGDLLEWEKKVKTLPEGSVVYHPGGSLASHYAVHAYLSNIPILVSREPKIGEILEPLSSKSTPDIIAMKRGFMLGCKIKVKRENAAYIMMAGCHHTIKWLGKADLLLGLAMGCCYRLLVTATLGEYRRRDRTILGTGSIGDRETEYNTYFPRTFFGITRKRYVSAMDSFDKEDWRNSSIGGPRWFLLARWAGLIFNALVDGNYQAALEALNNGVNSVHNGGWTFNKFISPNEMTYTANNPIHSILPVAPILYDAIKDGGIGLEKRFVEARKFKIEPLDPKTYLEEHRKRYKTEIYKKQVSSSSVKVCCTNECCGNPECEDCHPAVVIPKCDCEDHTCSICYPDGCDCNCISCHDTDWMCPNCCDCNDHDCENCCPNGCNCTNTDCHDCENTDCENCNPEIEEETEPNE
jgi:hypothetical protein